MYRYPKRYHIPAGLMAAGAIGFIARATIHLPPAWDAPIRYGSTALLVGGMVCYAVMLLVDELTVVWRGLVAILRRLRRR